MHLSQLRAEKQQNRLFTTKWKRNEMNDALFAAEKNFHCRRKTKTKVIKLRARGFPGRYLYIYIAPETLTENPS